mgnify:CR=1 FL=1
MSGVRRDELGVRVGEGAAGILPLVPLDSAHVGEELLHRALVAGEELAVQEARIPAEQNAADIEHDDAPLRRRCGHFDASSRTCVRAAGSR